MKAQSSNKPCKEPSTSSNNSSSVAISQPAMVVGVAAVVILALLTLVFAAGAGVEESSRQMKPGASGPHGVYCFGDDLTLGVSGREEFPYPKYLEHSLKNTSSEEEVIVQFHGERHATSAQYVRNLEDPVKGMLTKIREWSETSRPSLVVILLGSFELGVSKPGAADRISNDIILLHKKCFEANVQRSIIIGIPETYRQVSKPHVGNLATDVNQKLKEFAETERRATYLEAPFVYSGSSRNYHKGGFHFSARGYKAFGESLAPRVLSILQELDDGKIPSR